MSNSWDNSSDFPHESNSLNQENTSRPAMSAAVDGQKKSIVFIDSRVEDYQSLVNGVIPEAEVIVLDPNQDGVLAIAQAWQGRSNITSVHIVSHGSPGCLYLGNTQLSLDTFNRYATQLQQWDVTNLLLYGCNVAAGDAGEEFIEKLHRLTGASIAASTTLVGNSALGGNWQLEVVLGQQQPLLAFPSSVIAAYKGIFATNDFTQPTQAIFGFSGDPALWPQINLTFSDTTTSSITATDSGWVNASSNGSFSYDNSNTNFLAGFAGAEYRNYFLFDIASLVGKTVTSATITFPSSVTTMTPDLSESFELFDFNESFYQNGGLVGSGEPIHDDLITGQKYSASPYILNDSSDDQSFSLVLSTSAITDLNQAISNGDSLFGMGGAVTTLSGLNLAGITITPTTGLTTTEAGGTATFTVVLNSQPTANVTLGLSSSDTTEGTVSTSTITFTPTNWNVAQTVTVTGIDDLVADGDTAYNLTAVATSNDSNYSNLAPIDVALTNLDNDIAGFTITPITGLNTTEAGGSATFTIKLNTQPTSDVILGLSSSDTTEGNVSTPNLTFTTANWNVAQIVTVTGVDDLLADGNIPYQIITTAATSDDVNYNGLDPIDIAVTNTDNDTPGFTITPTTNLTTTEAGGAATFTVKLNSQPTADVTLGLSSSDTTEGTISTPNITFTSANWNVAQTVTIKGIDDAVVDGDIAYSIITAPAISTDVNYSGLNPVDVAVINIDNDKVLGNIINGTNVSETLTGTAQDDQINGYGGHDFIVGGRGKDIIYGGAGNDELIGDFKNLVGESVGSDDILHGGNGNDRMYGCGGNDSLYGDAGNDQIWGGTGNDLLWGGLGNDILTGGTGSDTFVLARGEGIDVIRDFQIGEDVIGLTGNLRLGQLSITQLGSQTLISDTFNNQTLALLNGVNAATLINQASSAFVRL